MNTIAGDEITSKGTEQTANRTGCNLAVSSRPAWLETGVYPFESRYCDLDSCRVHYLDEGVGPAILFLHAGMLGKSEANCRQILRRARQCLANRRTRFDTSPEQQERLMQKFTNAAAAGDMEELLALLAAA